MTLRDDIEKLEALDKACKLNPCAIWDLRDAVHLMLHVIRAQSDLIEKMADALLYYENANGKNSAYDDGWRAQLALKSYREARGEV